MEEYFLGTVNQAWDKQCFTTTINIHQIILVTMLWMVAELLANSKLMQINYPSDLSPQFQNWSILITHDHEISHHRVWIHHSLSQLHFQNNTQAVCTLLLDGENDKKINACFQ